MLNRDIKPVWGKRKAKDITKRDVILLLEGIQERGAPITANRTLACIRRMFNFAVERDILKTTPCLSVKALSKENRRARCLTLDEIKKFWHGIDADNAVISPATKIALKLQLVTAQRKGEIISAKWSNIELNTGWWTIPGEKAKNGLDHRVPLSPLALELLQELKAINSKSRWLFPSPKKGKQIIAGESVAYAIRRSNEAGVFEGAAAFTPHDLRRTAASHMTGMGIPRLVVSKILNHADRETTAVYDRHSYDTEKKNALDAWSNKLRRLISSAEEPINIVDFEAFQGKKIAG